MLLAACAAAMAQPAGAAVPHAQARSSAQTAAPAGIDVIEVSGLIDPVVVDFVSRSVGSAELRGRQALVVQLDSGGAVVSPAALDRLVARLRRSRVPVTVWIGPSGARARGAAARLVRAAVVAGMSPGSRLTVGRRTVGAEKALRSGAVETSAPTLGDFIVGLDGRQLPGGARLVTAREVRRGGRPRLEPAAQVSFAKLGLVPRLLHTVASPAVAYLLLLAGLLLVIFEFFSAGVGVAGGVGAACVVLAASGLAVLPVRPVALALLLVGLLGYCIDVQAGAPRTWTVIGALSVAAGSLTLYSGLALRWPALVIGIAGAALFMLGAMPPTLRSRFGTPTIGRESMVGEAGEATVALLPEGMVRVRGALWRARTNRATPIAVGSAVRVVAVDGVMLEVELDPSPL